jgi:hypothetical protein
MRSYARAGTSAGVLGEVSSCEAAGAVNGWWTAVQPPVVGRLEHREVGHPQELPAGVVHQPEPTADLEPGRAEQRQRVGAGAGGEEGAVADLRADRLAQPSRSDSDRFLATGPPSVPSSRNVTYARPARAALLGEVLPGVEDLAGLRRPARHDDGADVRRLEDAERRPVEVGGQVDELDAEAHVGRSTPKRRIASS